MDGAMSSGEYPGPNDMSENFTAGCQLPETVLLPWRPQGPFWGKGRLLYIWFG